MPLISGPPPKPGDLIEFIRPFYQHWGIYVGDGYVVHLTDQEGWSRLSSALGGSAVVRKDLLENVANGCGYRVNNKYDQKTIPYPPQDVVKAALDLVGQTMPYSVTSANCEHFATELRYGKCFSDQHKWQQGTPLTAGTHSPRLPPRARWQQLENLTEHNDVGWRRRALHSPRLHEALISRAPAHAYETNWKGVHHTRTSGRLWRDGQPRILTPGVLAVKRDPLQSDQRLPHRLGIG
ncbi:HRAS-like suppressor 3 [Pelobates cultripes]|nr:HRAS-like suppressor 3 [Pelobates cultripes]